MMSKTTANNMAETACPRHKWLQFRASAGFAALALLVSFFAVLKAPDAHAQPVTPYSGQQQSDEFTNEEILQKGHEFFGAVSQGLASAVETVFSRYGRPNGYVLGEEASGALLGGLRYGEGSLYTKEAGQHRVYWQGPSFGWDFGGNGARTMMLVYNLETIDAMYRRYGGISGSAYVVGGFGISATHNHNTIVVPIRSGVGARLGVNLNYLKFTQRATWNPF